MFAMQTHWEREREGERKGDREREREGGRERGWEKEGEREVVCPFISSPTPRHTLSLSLLEWACRNAGDKKLSFDHATTLRIINSVHDFVCRRLFMYTPTKILINCFYSQALFSFTDYHCCQTTFIRNIDISCRTFFNNDKNYWVL